MKIVLPVDENNNETSVCPSFGRTPYFLVYETDTKESMFLDNGAATSQGGAGVKAAQCIVDQNTDVLLTPRCGENAAAVISAAGIHIYRTDSGTAMDNIHAFLAGRLSPLEEIHAGFHHHEAQV
jgi:predicted Fe-Mo cluster-binding NifX family protein